MYLRVDKGPSVEVDQKQARARLDVTCGKTNKVVGSCTLYRGPKAILVYSTDKRRKVGENRLAFVFDYRANEEDILAKLPDGYEFRELLRLAGFSGPMVEVSLKDMVVSP